MSHIEEKYKEGLTMSFEVKKRLFSRQSEFQKVEIVESTHHGRMLFNDGCVMLSERDEAIYHEMIAHVPLFVHPNPKRVLVIGGGDGGTAREVLRHKNVEECVMVEIDGAVVEGCRQFIPRTSSVFSNPRLKLIIGDGVRFMAEDRSQFDVILIDSTDPVGPAAPLFGSEFYSNVIQRLAPQGIVVAQGETPFYEAETQHALLKILAPFFKVVKPYNFTNMTYPGGLWSFFYASMSLHPLNDFKPEKLGAVDFFYYNADLHRAAFALPSFMRQKLKDVIKDPTA
ncbi:MAG: polyamine aminopropyltransferase [Bdellovibrionales bacterium]